MGRLDDGTELALGADISGNGPHTAAKGGCIRPLAPVNVSAGTNENGSPLFYHPLSAEERDIQISRRLVGDVAVCW